MTRTRTLALGVACTLSVLLGACTSTPAPPAAPAWSPPAGWQHEMLSLINAHRANAGLGAVGLCGPLNLAAQNHSQDQANRRTMSHTGSDGSSLTTRMARAGYVGWTRISENVAYGQPDVVTVMNDWMNSKGHRANILGQVTAVGFGQARGSNGRIYWTQDFGTNGSC